jgi:uncharacterized protein
MIIIRDVIETARLPRYLTPNVEEALRSFPVVVLTGARQTGKSTLVRQLLTGPDRDYRSLDDLDVLERAEREPEALLASRRPLTLDEVQRSPRLLLAIKRAVDENRKPGRFLLSGSANLTLLRQVSETLAGRAVYLTLAPFTRAERLGLGTTGRWTEILADPAAFEGSAPAFASRSLLLETGFPVPALERERKTRSAWLEGYVRTYLERDLQTLSNVASLVDFRRFMRVAALRTGGLVNQTEIARDSGVSQPTVHRWLNLLEASYLLHRLPAYSVNRTRRLIKAPRLFFTDPGLAAYLAGVADHARLERAGLAGAWLESLVLADLLVWREGVEPRPEICTWRTAAGNEVDLVAEQPDGVVPIEVKSTTRPRSRDWHGLELFLDEYKDLAPHGVLLHCGTRCERVAPRIWAVPLSIALRLDGSHPAVGN